MRIALIVIYFLILAGIVLLSGNVFLLAGGSDSGVQVISSSMSLKLISIFVCGVFLVIALRLKKKSPLIMPLVLLLITMLLGLASHSVVLNHRHGVIEERWVLLKFERANYNLAEGYTHDWQAEPEMIGITFKSVTSNKNFFIFTGPAPWLTPFANFFQNTPESIKQNE